MHLVAYRCLSLLIVAYRCISWLIVAHRCLSLPIVVNRRLSLLIGAYRSSASRSIATQVMGSGQSRRDAAGSFLGELANSLERESEGKPCRRADPDAVGSEDVMAS